MERADMLERQVSVALEGGDGEDDIVKALDAELHRIVQFYQKKVCPCCRVVRNDSKGHK